MSSPIICIDGPSGSGKGTLATRIAMHFSYALLDSGSLYRLTGLAAQKAGFALDDVAAIAQCAKSLDVEFVAGESETTILLAGENVTDKIRTEAVGELASKVAAIPEVRAALLERQRAFAKPPGLVADGRDMGTVVFPDAPLKVFLTASAEERAKRRYEQLKAKGYDASLAALLKDIKDRDERDTNRAVAPLVPAADAHQLDSTQLSIDEVVKVVLKLAESI